MQSSYDILIEKQHLKHNARRQLTLFFKAVGLPLEDCLGRTFLPPFCDHPGSGCKFLCAPVPCVARLAAGHVCLDLQALLQSLPSRCGPLCGRLFNTASARGVDERFPARAPSLTRDAAAGLPHFADTSKRLLRHGPSDTDPRPARSFLAGELEAKSAGL